MSSWSVSNAYIYVCLLWLPEKSAMANMMVRMYMYIYMYMYMYNAQSLKVGKHVCGSRS